MGLMLQYSKQTLGEEDMTVPVQAVNPAMVISIVIQM